jgi:uncharacterized protein (DUF1697 family)
MAVYIALLRGINVGGHNRVAMADLRELVEGLGFAKVRTVLQSGNVVFEGQARSAAALERLLEKETKQKLRLALEHVVRSATEWHKIVARNPFLREAKEDPGHLVVVFLKTAPPAGKVKELQKAIQGREVVQCDGKQLYVVYPDGIGRSKLTGTVIEKQLGIPGTARNWNTVLKLAALCGGN